MLKGTKLYSIVKCTCPSCQVGQVFPEYNPYKLKSLLKVNPTCSNCGFNFNPEPSFYTGAMYVSYAFSVGIVVAVFVIAKFFFVSLPINEMIYSGVLLSFITAPINLRFSRIVWLTTLSSFK